MELSKLSHHVLATVAYCDQFEYPLTAAEIAQRLIRPGTVVAQLSLNQALADLVKSGALGFKDGFYFLAGSVQAVAIRRDRARYSASKWAEAQAVGQALSRIPWIKGLAVTGSLAMDNATQDDDIDFMIITQTQRLWATRPLVIAYAWWKGKRRSWQREEKNSWCFNLWLEEDQLHSPGRQQSLYTAYEVCQARFLLSRDRVEARFLGRNQWLARYLPSYFLERSRQATAPALTRDWWYQALHALDVCISGVMPVYNELAFWLQWAYMVPHRTREHVTRSVAFFHPRDTRQLIKSRWQKSLHHANT